MTSDIQAVHLSLQVNYLGFFLKFIFQCLMKITQHSRDFSPEFVTGQLLGMETDTCLEVSDSFPFASNLTDELEQEGNCNELIFNFFDEPLFTFRISN